MLFKTNKSKGSELGLELTVKMKNSSINMAPNGRIPAMRVLK